MPRAWHREYTGSARAVSDAIADPHLAAVYVVGPAGSGKSFLLGLLASPDADRSSSGERRDPSEPVDRPLVSLRPSQGTRDLTLEELLPVLHEPHKAALALAPTAERRPRIVAVDDIDQLDGSSLALLANAIDQHRVRLIATMRSSAASHVLGTLRIARESLVVTMPPWQRRDLDTFVDRRLGGRMHSLTAARILEFTGGNVLCVTELVDVASATGSLRREHDVWFCEEEPWVPPVTAARVGSELPHVSDAGREVMDTVALVGTTRLSDLVHAYGAAAVEDADEAGALRIEQHDGQLGVTLRSAIEARVIVQRMSTTRRHRLRTVLGAAQGSSGATPPRTDARHDEAGPSARLVRVLLTAGPVPALALAAGIDDATLTRRQRVAAATVTGWCHFFAGSLDRAQEYADLVQRHGLERGDAHTYQLGALLMGRCRLATGDVVGARFALSEAVVLRADPECAATARDALSPLALAYTMTGHDLDAVRTLDASMTRPATGTLGFRAGLDQLTRAEVMLENGLHHAAAERAARVASRCPATGQLLLAVHALHLCARARPTPSVADDLEQLADRLGYDLARTYGRHARAAATGDAAALADVAAAYDGLGLRRLAAETAAHALSLAEPPRTAAWAASSRRMLHRIRSDPAVTVPSWWWHEDARFVVLTDREREIAELAAVGATSPEIAERLQLSRRTVENHLQHTYRKLGIVRREQLPDALRHPAVVRARAAGIGGGP